MTNRYVCVSLLFVIQKNVILTQISYTKFQFNYFFKQELLSRMKITIDLKSFLA